MNWQQQQLLANQRRIREFQAQQNVINSQGSQYIHNGVHPYAQAGMYQPSQQQSYVYPPSTQWTVMSDHHQPRPQQPYPPAAYAQQYYPHYYPQRQAPNPLPSPPMSTYQLPPWHTPHPPRSAPLPKPSGRGMTYAELLSKALPPSQAPDSSPVQITSRSSAQQSVSQPPRTRTPDIAPSMFSASPKPPVVNLPKPPQPPPPTSKSESEAYPPSLLKYVERAFLQCKNDLEKFEIQKLLKLRIQCAKQDGVLWTQDWENMALPQLPSPAGPKRKSEMKLSKKQQKKLKKQQAMIAAATMSMSSNLQPFSIHQNQMGFPVNEVAVKIRNARFGKPSLNDTSSPARPLTLFHNRLRNENADGDIDLDWESLKIAGTCKQLEKKYLRLTSAPDPATVRPLSVLKLAFEHIMKRWKEDKNYLFFWEQMKSLRQDMTIQHIIEPFTITVYETNARVCLEVDDLSEYNQCQTQLSELYDNHNIDQACKRNIDEFLGYRLLYLLLTNDPMSISLMLHDTTPAARKNASLSHAIDTLRAFRTSDYCRFFNLSRSAPLLSLQIIRHLFPTVRYHALLRITAAFRPTLSVSETSEMLGFTELDSCRAWLIASGAVLDSARDQILCKESNIIRAQLPDGNSQETVGVTHGTF